MRKKKQFSIKKPTHNMIPVEEALFLAQRFASEVIMNNEEAANYLGSVLDLYREKDVVEALQLICSFVSVADEVRRDYYNEHCDDPMVVQCMASALKIRKILGLGFGESVA